MKKFFSKSISVMLVLCLLATSIIAGISTSAEGITYGAAGYTNTNDKTNMSAPCEWETENVRIGNASAKLCCASGGGAKAIIYTPTSPVDFTNADSVEMWVYMPQEALTAANEASSGGGFTLYFELASGGNYNKNCVRYLWNGTTTTQNAVCKTFSAGWNKIKLPKEFTITSGNYCYVNNVWCGYGSQQTDYSIDWSAINYMRIIISGAATIGQYVLVNGMGFGFDFMLDGEYAGNDFAEVVSRAADGSTVTLNTDVAEANIGTVAAKNIKIDYNGYNINPEVIKAITSKGTTVTLCDNHTLCTQRPVWGSLTASYDFSNEEGVTCEHRYTHTELEAANCTQTGLENLFCSLCGEEHTEVIPITHKMEAVARIEATWRSEGNIAYFHCTECGKNFTDENGTVEVEEVKLSKLDANYIEETDAALIYDGNWMPINNLKGASEKSIMRGSKSGSTVSFTFNGKSLGIIGYTSPSYGKISVKVDDGEAQTVDLYSPSAVYQALIYEKFVGEGVHKVTITILNTKNTASSGKGLYYAAIDRLVTDGQFISADRTISDLEMTVSRQTSTLTFPEPFVVGEESSALEVSALYGSITATGKNTADYTVSALHTSDVITYSVNGFTGIANVKYDSGIVHQFEELDASESWKPFNSYYFDGHRAIYTKNKGTEISFTVNAAAIELIGYRSNTYSSFDVYVDGVFEKTVNEYVADGYFYKESLGIVNFKEEGSHMVTIKTNGKTLLDSYRLSEYENFNGVDTMQYSERGKFLYDTTYQTMIDRITDYGYAPTSITGAYWGMFSRDSAIQIMSHIANGDSDAAQMLLNYAISYHVQNDRKYMLHIMNDYLEVDMHSNNSPADPGVRYQTVGSIGLYGINAPGNGAAQYYIPEYDQNIAQVDLKLSTAASTGYFEMTITEDTVDGTVIGSSRINITSPFTSATWVSFKLDTPVALKAGQKYCLNIRAWDNGGARTVAWGQNSIVTFNSYAYDLKRDRNQTMCYRLLTEEEVNAPVTDDSARIQTEGTVGLYGINAPGNGAAQYFIPKMDLNISNIEFRLSTMASTGYFEVSVSENDINGTVIATARKDITESFTSATWVRFDLDSNITLKAGQKYAISVRAWDNGGARTVAYGSKSVITFNSYAYDVAVNRTYTMAYKLLTPADIAEEMGEVYYEQVGTLKDGEQMSIDLGFSKNYVTVGQFALGYDGTADGTLHFDLYKGSSYVISKSISASELTPKASMVRVPFGLSLDKVTDTGKWNVVIRAEGFDANGVKLYGNASDGFAWKVAESDITQNSERIQVDANYMFINSYAMFALGYYDQYSDFIEKTFDTILGYASYFMENFNDEEGGYNPDLGLILNPCLEHGRGYMRCYDPMTNCFAAESMHKLAKVANRLGRLDVSETLSNYADMISEGINTNLTCTMNGKTIYTEVIDIGNDKYYKGFSFVSLAPVASDWYAVDETILANTYEEYRKVGAYDFSGFDITSSYVDFDDNDQVIKVLNYICGKALGWELYYCWKTGDTARTQELLDFIDAYSSDGGFDEGYFSDGKLRDTANQEHANWLYYEFARVCGLYKYS